MHPLKLLIGKENFNKKGHKEIIIGTVVIILIVASCFVSSEKFRTFNPIKGGIGFAKILIFYITSWHD